MQHAGLGARIGDLLQGGRVGVVSKTNLEDFKLASLSDTESSAELLLDLVWDLLLDLLTKITAANLILVYAE